MNRFVKTCLDVFSPLGIGLQAAAGAIENALREELSWLSPIEAVLAYQTDFPLRDAATSDYCSKLIRIAGPKTVITSLQFQNSGGEGPFIDIPYSSFPLNIDATPPLLRDAIVNQYRTSSPEFISFFVAGDMRSAASYEIKPAKALYAANLNQRFPMLRHPDLSIHKAADTGFYERYQAEYQAFNDASPRNRLVSQPEEPAYLDALVSNGTLFEITIGGRWAGVIAYDYLPALSLPGFEIVESFIIDRFRGRGFAKYAQSLLIDHLQSDNHQRVPFVFGTIHAGNEASIRTARDNGRQLLGAWYEMPFRKPAQTSTNSK